ncbi:hypothetical protein GC102_11885 [Paenibacillus sp. LMG 31460]|uniref:Intracellular proteinase inhibitor BsuPI domain-containing protein n=1 Tax=Paenibacillus germinis TaxID=2654979 RepID=A0ABX1YZQ0_9BACL|nr:BsuPI-related putative proteinase inhibitor [Paenibacillus germinis]NOU86467.1 hypothetical protein [Paenibacillus germinis]
MGKGKFFCGLLLCTLFVGCSAGINKDHQALENLEPVQVDRGITIDTEIEKRLLKEKEEKSKPVSGLFKTSLALLKEDRSVKLNFSLQNVSGKDQQISYGSGQKYDIFIYNEQKKEIYKWSINKAFTQALIIRGFKNNEKLTFNEEWNLNDNKGNPVPSGNYTIVVKVMIDIDMESGKISPYDLTDKSMIEIAR